MAKKEGKELTPVDQGTKPMIFLECRGKLFRVRSKNFSSAVEKVLGCVLEKGSLIHYLCYYIL